MKRIGDPSPGLKYRASDRALVTKVLCKQGKASDPNSTHDNPSSCSIHTFPRSHSILGPM